MAQRRIQVDSTPLAKELPPTHPPTPPRKNTARLRPARSNLGLRSHMIRSARLPTGSSSKCSNRWGAQLDRCFSSSKSGRSHSIPESVKDLSWGSEWTSSRKSSASIPMSAIFNDWACLKRSFDVLPAAEAVQVGDKRCEVGRFVEAEDTCCTMTLQGESKNREKLGLGKSTPCPGD